MGKLLILILLAASSIEPPKLQYCLPEGQTDDPALSCPCTRLHPELCMTEDPLPNCCRATEENTKAKGGCHCCGQHK